MITLLIVLSSGLLIGGVWGFGIRDLINDARRKNKSTGE